MIKRLKIICCLLAIQFLVVSAVHAEQKKLRIVLKKLTEQLLLSTWH